MKRFAALYEALDGTTSTNAKVAALVAYFASAPAADAAWALYFLTGRRFKRFLSTALLREWTLGLTGLPSWLFEDAYATVGDLAETIALLLDHPSHTPSTEELPLSPWIEERLLPLRGLDDMEQRQAVCRWWQALDRRQLFLLNKLLTGAFRVGVSETLVVRAVAQMAGLPPATVAHRLMGEWTPSAAFFQELTAQEAMDDDRSRPYPFCLAYQLDQDVAQLGNRDDWLAEWKWDGIRAQLIRRGDAVYLWSRGEELVTDRFPELREAGLLLPEGTVLDGEIVAFRDGVPLPFSTLQHRIGRQRLTAKVLTEVPVVFLSYDLLEADGVDLRACMLSQRRARLAHLLAQGSPHLLISPALDAPRWDALAQRRRESRARHVEGLMLKRLSSPYHVGRRRGDWWKWKIDPYAIDAVLIYAQAGHGRRATLFTDYTFAVWQGEALVPIAKAYSGLSDDEIDTLDRWIRQHTIERFGPVRAVEPVHVFELAFEGLAPSTRHRAGIALRFPRIARWRTDKTAREADTLERVKALLQAPREPPSSS
jgi:DNA ligase-1